MFGSKSTPHDYEVIIVGAGPTGLTLALQLARYSVRFLLIDKKAIFTSLSEGFSIQASTLEILNDFNISDGLQKLGVQVKKFNAYINGKPSFDMDFKQAYPIPYPYTLNVEQSKTERLLAGALQKMGHTIHWNTELLSFKQNRSGVSADIKQEGKKSSITASFIVGCDGEESIVRKQLGLPLEGNTHTEKFILADLALDWALTKDEGYAFLHPSDLFAVFPLPNEQYRVITTQNGINHKGDITVKDLATKFQKLCPVMGALTAPTWMTAYNVQRRMTSKMRVNRAFLAGQACHIHSPIGGQSINAGIHDAYNLGWKLGSYLRGYVDERFLDSYEDERIHVARATLAHTNLAMNIVMTHSKLGRIIRDIVSPLVLNYPAAQKQLGRIIADTRSTYSRSHVFQVGSDPREGVASKLKDSFLGGVSVGNRAPSIDLYQPVGYKRFQLLTLLQTPKHVMLIFLGEKAKEFDQHYAKFRDLKKELAAFADSYFIVGEHAIDYSTFDPNLKDVFIDPDGLGHQTYHCEEPTLYLLRPDGYIAYKGSLDGEALKTYIKSLFNLDRYKEEETLKKQLSIETVG